MTTIRSIGHSTHPIERPIARLREHDVAVLANGRVEHTVKLAC